MKNKDDPKDHDAIIRRLANEIGVLNAIITEKIEEIENAIYERDRKWPVSEP